MNAARHEGLSHLTALASSVASAETQLASAKAILEGEVK